MKKLAALLILLCCTLPLSAQAAETLLMATTTSTQDSGLLEYLAPVFTAETGIDLKWVAVGTGKALELGKNCDVDVLLVHAPDAEKAFVAAGHGIHRHQVMYNDFVLVGPKADPAKIAGKTLGDALRAIGTHKALFISRGDNSGTHSAEKKLWQTMELPLPDKEAWYISAGQGMLATLTMAAEKNAYALTDRGTWIKYHAKQGDASPLKIIVEGDSALFNQYSVMEVNPAMCPKAKPALAQKFVQWWINPATQTKIAAFQLEGKQLFFPNADK